MGQECLPCRTIRECSCVLVTPGSLCFDGILFLDRPVLKLAEMSEVSEVVRQVIQIVSTCTPSIRCKMDIR